ISEAAYTNFHQYLPDFIMNPMWIDGVMYHPTLLYESYWNMLAFISLLVLRRYNLLRGEVFLRFVITYSSGSFFVQGMRTDSLNIGGIRVAQLISILLIVGTVALIVHRRKSGQAKERYNYKIMKEKR